MSEAISEWQDRSGVLYHFYAYHYFDKSTGGIDLINLDDADVEYFNRIANITRGLSTQYKLAEYLKNYESPTTNANTHRTRFLHHVRSYNATHHPRRRFYFLNLSTEDVKFLEDLNGTKKGGANGLNGNVKSGLVWATDCCELGIVTCGEDEDVDGEVEKCLAAREQDLECKMKALSVIQSEPDIESKKEALKIIQNGVHSNL